ncbi:DNA-binding protein RFX6 isoform X3 [Parasteatoda tepidariorum]|uniref:DNA-binding protein RFX6 isoform X3 n=1 Tax=Parasteatoda tepidariorum TaxID=114398 RepID=UPI00077FB4D9|nr:DNA-binding protein RFX6 isoform X3 [Parasteatoda tepidariorum]
MNERKRKKLTTSAKERKLHISITVEWLKENCSPCPDVCLPREILYAQYTDFCKNQNTRPTCKATFGKLVRNTFPEVTSKRLGARGQSKYHYSGIGIKSDGVFTTMCSTEGVTRFSRTSNERKGTKVINSKIGTLLPMFPDVEDLYVPSNMNQRKIRLFLLHFWQGFPNHLLSIFEYELTTDVLIACDSILHRTLIDILIPSEIIEIPEKLLRDIQNVASHWQIWLTCALENMPISLKSIKMETAKRFCAALKRHVALLHFSQVARPILSQIPLKSLYNEILNLEAYEKNHFIKTAPKCNDSPNKVECDVMNLLEKVIDIEQLMECLDVVILNNIYQENVGAESDKEEEFLLLWVYTLNRLSHLLSENQSDHFITLHFWVTFIQEYLMLAVETRRMNEKQNLIFSNLNKHIKTKEKYGFNSFKSATSCFMIDSKRCFEREIKHSKSSLINNTSKKIIADRKHQNIEYSQIGKQQTKPCWDFNGYVPLETSDRELLHWNETNYSIPLSITPEKGPFINHELDSLRKNYTLSTDYQTRHSCRFF